MSKCEWCGKEYTNSRVAGPYCSNKCRYSSEKLTPKSQLEKNLSADRIAHFLIMNKYGNILTGVILLIIGINFYDSKTNTTPMLPINLGVICIAIGGLRLFLANKKIKSGDK